MTRQTILVTGATDGLGRALAEELARRGAQVLLHGRDDDRGRTAIEEIAASTGNDQLGWYKADFADLSQVAAMAAAVAHDHPELDVLVNNAGIGAETPGGGQRQTSVDGYELRFAVNYLAGYLLTCRLLGTLRAAAERSGSARIVFVASAGQEALRFDDLMLEHSYSGHRAYRQSKLAQVMQAFDLARQLDGTGVTVNALHPSTYMDTKIVPHPVSRVADGVRAVGELVLSPQWAGRSGRYVDVDREVRADPQAYDEDARKALADASARLCEQALGAGTGARR